MNFVSHIHLALGHRREPEPRADPGDGSGPDGLTGFLIGSALPDFASMGRFRLTVAAEEPSVRAGVAFHHRTDDAFHTHPWFRANSDLVSDDLEAAGLSRGAAMACGHVGVELLLDGQLLDENDGLREATDEATEVMTDAEFRLASMVDQDRTADWSDHLHKVSAWPLPDDYRDPTAVAGRLERILARRPRLAFSSHQRFVVASVLARHQPTLEAGSAELISDLGRKLAEPAGNGR